MPARGATWPPAAQWRLGETYFHQRNYRQAIREYLKVDILYDAPVWQAAALFEAEKPTNNSTSGPTPPKCIKRPRHKFPKDSKAAEAKSLLEGVRKRLASQPDPAKTADTGKP